MERERERERGKERKRQFNHLMTHPNGRPERKRKRERGFSLWDAVWVGGDRPFFKSLRSFLIFSLFQREENSDRHNNDVVPLNPHSKDKSSFQNKLHGNSYYGYPLYQEQDRPTLSVSK